MRNAQAWSSENKTIFVSEDLEEESIKSCVLLLRLCFPFPSCLLWFPWWWQLHHLISFSWRRLPVSQHWLLPAGQCSPSANVRAVKLPLEVTSLSHQMFPLRLRSTRGCFRPVFRLNLLMLLDWPFLLHSVLLEALTDVWRLLPAGIWSSECFTSSHHLYNLLFERGETLLCHIYGHTVACHSKSCWSGKETKQLFLYIWKRKRRP